MKTLLGLYSLLPLFGVLALSPMASAQSLPGTLSFSIDGSFTNGTAQTANSILITDNDLTNGYDAGFDLADAPSSVNLIGPEGSAAFQWGVASTTSNYPHTSALWFVPLSVANLSPEQSFDLGYLYYRNGTIKNNTGASAVDLALTVSFTQPLGLDPISVVFGSDLLNTPNTSDPINSADIVSLKNTAAPVNFTDAAGNSYFLELTFKVDQSTIDGTLSTPSQFRVFEGGQGSATLQGRFTTCPIPEPSSAVLAALASLLFFRRKR
ncbi:MAG: choice-of-anchor K domain-containing protein [Gloeobacteraceae cyanobacterium ES-bin-144]|nr:choice-of-anchor K domain-containing protein [Verrucomicrobiales bacterium]